VIEDMIFWKNTPLVNQAIIVSAWSALKFHVSEGKITEL
jgi:hypothetical protein